MTFFDHTAPSTEQTLPGKHDAYWPHLLWLATWILCCLPVMSLAASEGLHEELQAVSADNFEESASPNERTSSDKSPWRELEPGLHYGEFQLESDNASLTVLRIDPAHFDFVLCARSQYGGPGRTLRQWGEEQDLTAAINASMYLPDGSTSTGYMRQDGHVNNGRMVRRFGAFFVAGPAAPALPEARIVEKEEPQWREILNNYRVVIQNYRMISGDRRILWSPGGPLYSISAVAEDSGGNILFLHCRRPVEAYALARQLLQLPLNIRTVMYVEGGGQAGLLVRSTALTHEEGGLSLSEFLITGNLRATLPNVLGVRRKASPPVAQTGKNTLLPPVFPTK
ncbi:MAG: phosphodiester glycosidase family protein [Desulfovibrio sp.]|nr:phosphodiester glycosidase family protein [Desulfovibrio sp.]